MYNISTADSVSSRGWDRRRRCYVFTPKRVEKVRGTANDRWDDAIFCLACKLEVSPTQSVVLTADVLVTFV